MTINVELYNSTTAETGYSSATGSDGNTYYYKYTGGSDGAGNVMETVGNGQDILVTLQTTGYTVYTASTSNDPESQLGVSVNPGSTTVTIGDRATAAESNAEYTVTVQTTINGGNVTIPCDPRVTNTSN